jgi:3-oxoisoapionate decarboxylase
VPVHIETISGFSKPFPYLKADFWKPYSTIPVADFAKFVALAKKGKPYTAPKSDQKNEIERSIKYCQQVLGLGLKG